MFVAAIRPRNTVAPMAIRAKEIPFAILPTLRKTPAATISVAALILLFLVPRARRNAVC